MSASTSVVDSYGSAISSTSTMKKLVLAQKVANFGPPLALDESFHGAIRQSQELQNIS